MPKKLKTNFQEASCVEALMDIGGRAPDLLDKFKELGIKPLATLIETEDGRRYWIPNIGSGSGGYAVEATDKPVEFLNNMKVKFPKTHRGRGLENK